MKGTTIFPYIRPLSIIFLLGLLLRVLLNFTYIKVCQVQALLELRAIFEGGPYMRKYGIHQQNLLLRSEGEIGLIWYLLKKGNKGVHKKKMGGKLDYEWSQIRNFLHWQMGFLFKKSDIVM